MRSSRETRKQSDISGIIVHRAEIDPTSPDYQAYHLLVEKDGRVCRLVPDLTVAPHAKDFNRTTLAVVVFGDFASAEPGRNSRPTSAQLTALTQVINGWRSKYGDLWVAGHSELGTKGTRVASKLTAGHTCPGEHLNVGQLRHDHGWLECPKALLA